MEFYKPSSGKFTILPYESKTIYFHKVDFDKKTKEGYFECKFDCPICSWEQDMLKKKWTNYFKERMKHVEYELLQI